jgi:hypothetical protein
MAAVSGASPTEETWDLVALTIAARPFKRRSRGAKIVL